MLDSLDSLFFLNLPAKKAGEKTQWVARNKNLQIGKVRGQTQTPLLAHCTNLCPLNFIGLDNSDRNSGVNLKIYNDPKNRGVNCCMQGVNNFHQSSTRPPIGPI